MASTSVDWTNVHPRRRVAERVERRAAEQHRHHAHEPGADHDRRQVGQRAEDPQPTVVLLPDRQLRQQGRVHLERVGLVVERVAEQCAADQHHRDVQRAPQPYRAQLGAVGVDQLDPHERVQPERGRPVAQPGGVGVEALAAATGQPTHEGVDRADRAHRAPHRTEEQRRDGQSDPPPHVEHPEDGVGEQVLAEDRREGEEAEEEQADRAQGDVPPGRGGQRREPGRGGSAQRVIGRPAVVPGVAPRQREDTEGHGQGRDCTRDRQLGWQGQVLGPADPVLQETARDH